MKKIVSVMVLVAAAAMAYSPLALSHCQVPCGIYDDHARVNAMFEDAATTRKAVNSLTELSGKTDPQSNNQIVRWVMNKEKHAQNIIATISDYFLTQRVKPSQEDYIERLQRHHAVIIAAMKVKQNADMKFVIDLEAAITGLAGYYPEHKH